MTEYLGDYPTGVRPEQDEVGKDSARQFQPEEMELVYIVHQHAVGSEQLLEPKLDCISPA